MISKFKEIANDLEHKIISGQYPPATLLPSETQLLHLYNVSRETIRKALNELQVSGFIQKKQGKGSIVIDRKMFDFPISGLTSYHELQKNLGLNGETLVLHLEKEPVDEALAHFTHWSKDNLVWHLERLRIVEGQNIIYDLDYFLVDVVPQMTEKIAKVSTYGYLEDKLKLEIAYAQKEITVEDATKKDREYLTLGNENKVVVVRSLVYLEDNRCFQYTESRHVLDKFRFVDFARRRKI